MSWSGWYDVGLWDTLRIWYFIAMLMYGKLIVAAMIALGLLLILL